MVGHGRMVALVNGHRLWFVGGCIHTRVDFGVHTLVLEGIYTLVYALFLGLDYILVPVLVLVHSMDHAQPSDHILEETESQPDHRARCMIGQ
jgi:hypothetical protein